MPWQPGQSGNPLGGNKGPREKPWRRAIQRALKREQTLERSKQGVLTPTTIVRGVQIGKTSIIAIPAGQALEHIADMCVQQAICGNEAARREIGDRLDGKAAPQMDDGDFVPIAAVRWLDDLPHENGKISQPLLQVPQAASSEGTQSSETNGAANEQSPAAQNGNGAVADGGDQSRVLEAPGVQDQVTIPPHLDDGDEIEPPLQPVTVLDMWEDEADDEAGPVIDA